MCDHEVLSIMQRLVVLQVGPVAHDDDALGGLVVESFRIGGNLALPRNAVVVGNATLVVHRGDQSDHRVSHSVVEWKCPPRARVNTFSPNRRCTQLTSTA